MIEKEVLIQISNIFAKNHIHASISENTMMLSDGAGFKTEIRSLSPSVIADDLKVAVQLHPAWQGVWYEVDDYVFSWHMDRIAKGESTSRYSAAGIRIYDDSVKYYGFRNIIQTDFNKTQLSKKTFHKMADAWTMDRIIDNIEDALHFTELRIQKNQNRYELIYSDGELIGEIKVDGLIQFVESLRKINRDETEKLQQTAEIAVYKRDLPA